jgi:hypothetical protein
MGLPGGGRLTAFGEWWAIGHREKMGSGGEGRDKNKQLTKTTGATNTKCNNKKQQEQNT